MTTLVQFTILNLQMNLELLDMGKKKFSKFARLFSLTLWKLYSIAYAFGKLSEKFQTANFKASQYISLYLKIIKNCIMLLTVLRDVRHSPSERGMSFFRLFMCWYLKLEFSFSSIKIQLFKEEVFIHCTIFLNHYNFLNIK